MSLFGDGTRPFGVALWEDRGPLCSVVSRPLAEVKIIGVKTSAGGKKKVLVWKHYAAGDKPVWIDAENIPKHAKDLMDPPEGTTDEYPPVGDIKNPESFTHSGQIEPMPGKEKVPEMGHEQQWIPSHKLKMLAKKLKDAGIQPQNTFSKAVAAGEPLPTKMPEPLGLEKLPKAEPAKAPETPPEAPKEPEAPAPAPEPEKPKEPTPEPGTDEFVDDAVAKGDYGALVKHADKLTADQLTSLAMDYGDAKDAGDHQKALDLADTMSKVLKAKKQTSAANSWETTAKFHAQQVAKGPAEPEPAPEPEKPAAEPEPEPAPEAPKHPSSGELLAAISKGDMAPVLAHWEAADSDHVLAISAAADEASKAKDFKKAGEYYQVAADISKWKGYTSAAESYSSLASAYKTMAETGEKPKEVPPAPPPPPEAPSYPQPAFDPDWVFDFEGKEGAKKPTAEEAKAKMEGLGLNPSEFVSVTGEIFSVINLQPDQYVDPDTGVVYDKKTGSKVSGVKVASSGAVYELPDPTDDTAPSGKVQTNELHVPAEAKVSPPPPPPEKITPSKITSEDVPPEQPVAPTDDPVKETASAKAVKKIKAPDYIPKVKDLKLVGSGNNMGGAGDKNIYVDANGQKWLHKLAYDKYGGKPKPYAAAAQQAFSEVARMVRPDHIPIGVMTIKGKIGTLQPLLDLDPDQPDLKPGGKNIAMTKLSDEDRRSIAGEHVLDWLMSQHDSHGGQFIRAADGKIYGIDKEQGFRFFGVDKLDVNYHPNPDQPPLYNDLWKGWVRGDYDMDPQSLVEEIEKIEAISPKDYIKTMRPYVEALYPDKPEEQRKLLKAIRKRKLDIRKDFERFFTNLYRAKNKTDKGEFTFDKGWSGDAQGPKVVKKKYKSADMLGAPSGSAGGREVTLPGFSGLKIYPWHNPDNPNEKDETKLTLKAPVSDQGSVEKMKHFLNKLGIKPISDAHLAGSQYVMLFINKADFEQASVEVEETVEPTGLGNTPKKARYFPDEHEHPSVSHNADEIKSIQSMKLGRAGRRFSADGPAVEGSLLRAKKYRAANGDEYHLVHFKLRPSQWKPLASGGSDGKFEFKLASYNSDTDSYEEIGSHSDTVQTRKWKVGNTEVHLAHGSDKYAYMGSVYMKVRPKKGQTIHQAMVEALDGMKPGLSEQVFRNPTPEENEIRKLRRLLWSEAPQEADKLAGKVSGKAEDAATTIAELKQKLADVGVTEERLAQVEEREVFPGYSCHVEPGRHKRLAGGKFAYLMQGVGDKAGVLSILKTGVLGIHERNMHGIAKFGGSYESDVQSGSGDGTLFRTITHSGFSSSMQSHSFSGTAQVIVHPDELDRHDAYMYRSDTFGRCREDAHTWTGRKSIETQMKEQQQHYSTGAEISFRRGVAPEKILRVVCSSEQTRKDLIKQARDEGILEHNGVPIEDFIVVASNAGDIYEKYVRPLVEE